MPSFRQVQYFYVHFSNKVTEEPLRLTCLSFHTCWIAEESQEATYATFCWIPVALNFPGFRTPFCFKIKYLGPQRAFVYVDFIYQCSIRNLNWNLQKYIMY